MNRNPPPIVRRAPERNLLDLRSLMILTGRSRHTIRLRCPVVCYTPDGRALYDPQQARAILDQIPTRQRAKALGATV